MTAGLSYSHNQAERLIRQPAGEGEIRPAAEGLDLQILHLGRLGKGAGAEEDGGQPGAV